jgi:biotin transport system substrate-specific component
MVAADLWRPSSQAHAVLVDVLLVLLGSLVVALSAQIAIPLWFSPVPVTAQSLAVVVVGSVLGARRGALALVAYLVEGAVGLPVFAAGAAGVARLLGPTGGYLLGFVAAAALSGWLAERGWDRRLPTSLLAMAAGMAILFVPGLLWLGAFVGHERVLALGLWPFLPGAAIKLAVAAVLLPIGWRLAGRDRRTRA